MAKNRLRLLSRPLLAAFLLGALAGVFGYGVLVGRFQTFPYHLLQSSKQALVVVLSTAADDFFGYAPERTVNITTSLTRLTAVTANSLNRPGLDGDGGGLTIIGRKVVGVDRGAPLLRL